MDFGEFRHKMCKRPSSVIQRDSCDQEDELMKMLDFFVSLSNTESPFLSLGFSCQSVLLTCQSFAKTHQLDFAFPLDFSQLGFSRHLDEGFSKHLVLNNLDYVDLTGFDPMASLDSVVLTNSVTDSCCFYDDEKHELCPASTKDFSVTELMAMGFCYSHKLSFPDFFALKGFFWIFDHRCSSSIDPNWMGYGVLMGFDGF